MLNKKEYNNFLSSRIDYLIQKKKSESQNN